MIKLEKIDDITGKYEMLLKVMSSYLVDESNGLTILSNASAILNFYLPSINWVGFYLSDGTWLNLGPFQGKPACSKIKLGSGVCGTAAMESKTLVVKDVEKFEGHIACDTASRSEIVVPIFLNMNLFGVLDIDSPFVNRFDNTDEEYLNKIGLMIGEKLTELKA